MGKLLCLQLSVCSSFIIKRKELSNFVRKRSTTIAISRIRGLIFQTFLIVCLSRILMHFWKTTITVKNLGTRLSTQIPFQSLIKKSKKKWVELCTLLKMNTIHITITIRIDELHMFTIMSLTWQVALTQNCSWWELHATKYTDA